MYLVHKVCKDKQYGIDYYGRCNFPVLPHNCQHPWSLPLRTRYCQLIIISLILSQSILLCCLNFGGSFHFQFRLDSVFSDYNKSKSTDKHPEVLLTKAIQVRVLLMNCKLLKLSAVQLPVIINYLQRNMIMVQLL